MGERLEILPVTGIGDVTPGADLAELIASAAPWLRDGDVLVVTSKIVSKAEGRLVDVPVAGPQRAAAREEALAAETARAVAQRGHTRIVQTHHGFVLASAGIDASNVDRARLVLLPKEPDSSARALRAALRERAGVDVAVIISDTMGRPWRIGLTDVAIGAAGIEPIRDHRGETDPYGNELFLTQVAVVDELAGAAELVKGKCDQIPVAVVRGLPGPPVGEGPGAAALVRDAAQDLFSLGTAEARVQGLRDAAALSDVPAFKPVAVRRSVVARVVPPDFTLIEPDRLTNLPPHTTWVIQGPETADLVALGMAWHRLRCALAAEGLGTIWLSDFAALAVGPPSTENAPENHSSYLPVAEVPVTDMPIEMPRNRCRIIGT